MSREANTVPFTAVPGPDQKPFPFRLHFPPELPISARAGEIVDAIQAHPVLVLAGETGSGKTTQIPKLCLAAGRGVRGRIACTQPRRVAALSVSRRVAEELGVDYGRAVGCKVRFSDQTSRDTVVKFMTDGMLLAEVQGDPLMREYDTVIIDEAHERSLNIDFLLGHLRQLRHRRPELRIIITSATIDTAVFSKAFDDAPVIEVSGRTWPVEVIYAPLDDLGADTAEGDAPESRPETLHYIDGAVEAVQRVLASSDTGDVLVFMPAERDIRETIDLLTGRTASRVCDLVPLFGRLSNSEQQRVFATTNRRRIIVATNIAETSLTLPGIRFVVDTGLARISRYLPQGRTRRLPIEAVAQSSADQRKGRAGRVEAGVCVRLYSEKDFNERPRFTQPEIQRANLADVILRMKAFGLGDIDRFPFINMPAAKAIRAGYALLEELHAFASSATASAVPGAHELSGIGRELARLPVDPTVGRMILQARDEKALHEVLIIAAGLSVQDPRERPLDKQAAADAAHRRFTHGDSDFLTLLNIWETLHDEFERLSQARMRRWCRDHFLSYTRMREWRDIHAQLLDTVRDRNGLRTSSVRDGVESGEVKLGFGSPAYRAIHRSILAGLLGNIAALDEDKGGYRATHDRRVVIFPGSALFVREERKRPGAGKASAKPSTASAGRGPRWIMAAEIVETARIYARTCARLDPQWTLDLAEHLVQVAHREPFWDEDKGRVMVRRRTRLYGLEIESRAVGYAAINPEHATEIFIREALVNDTITWPFDFLRHNREVRAQVESELTRLRDRGFLNLDEAVYRFYEDKLVGVHAVGSVGDLKAVVRERKPHEPAFLQFKAADLRGDDEPELDRAAYPESVPLTAAVLPLNYVYRPGEADDGVSLDVPVRDAAALTDATLDWAVPGHLAAKVEHYLRALPKDLRRVVMPLAQTVRELTPKLASRDRLTGRRETLPVALAALLGERFQVRLDPAVWADRPLPDHLRVRVRVVDDGGRELAASRELDEIQTAIAAHVRHTSARAANEVPGVWRRACAQWETDEIETWAGPDLPESVEIGERGGAPLLAYPVFQAVGTGVAVRLQRTAEAAAHESQLGLRRLLAQALRYDLAWLEKDLRALRELGPEVATFAKIDALRADALAGLTAWLTDPTRFPASDGVRTVVAFEAAVREAKAALRGLVPRLMDRLREILGQRQALLLHSSPYPDLAAELAELVPPTVLRTVPYPQLEHLPRYLQAKQVRAERRVQDPARDEARAREVAVVTRQWSAMPAGAGKDAVRWLIEEFRVSVFAQHLGTAVPVSAKKISAEIACASGATGEVDPSAKTSKKAPKPLAIGPVAGATKTKPLKSFTALDGLFKR